MCWQAGGWGFQGGGVLIASRLPAVLREVVLRVLLRVYHRVRRSQAGLVRRHVCLDWRLCAVALGFPTRSGNILARGVGALSCERALHDRPGADLRAVG